MSMNGRNEVCEKGKLNICLEWLPWEWPVTSCIICIQKITEKSWIYRLTKTCFLLKGTKQTWIISCCQWYRITRIRIKIDSCIKNGNAEDLHMCCSFVICVSIWDLILWLSPLDCQVELGLNSCPMQYPLYLTPSGMETAIWEFWALSFSLSIGFYHFFETTKTEYTYNLSISLHISTGSTWGARSRSTIPSIHHGRRSVFLCAPPFPATYHPSSQQQHW